VTAVLAVAQNTFREAVRDRVLYLLVFFAVLVILGSEGLAVLAVGDSRKVALDLGLAAISFFGVLISVFLGLSQFAREIDRRTVYTVISKPISRSGFIAGKLAGLYATVVVLTLGMTVVFLAFVWLRHDVAEPRLLAAVVLFLVENLVLASLAVLFASFTTPILATLFTMTMYVIGHLSFGLKLLAGHERVAGSLFSRVMMGLYWVLPNLERFNVKGQVVHGDPLPEGLVLPILYGIVYAAAIFLVSTEIFRRRDFV